MYYHSHVVDFVESASDTRRAVMSMPTAIYNSYLKDHGVFVCVAGGRNHTLYGSSVLYAISVVWHTWY